MAASGTAPVLVFACGNPSRGDDALGPLLVARLERLRDAGRLQGVDLLTDFQLQVEHALDLEGRETVIFVDASASGIGPFAFVPVAAERDVGYTSHAMSPGAVLQVFRQTTGQEPPPSWLLAVRGYEFGLGEPVSRRAHDNLGAAEAYLLDRLSGKPDDTHGPRFDAYSGRR